MTERDKETVKLYEVEQELRFSSEQLEFLNVLKDHYFNLGYDLGMSVGWFEGYQVGRD